MMISGAPDTYYMGNIENFVNYYLGIERKGKREESRGGGEGKGSRKIKEKKRQEKRLLLHSMGISEPCSKDSFI